MNLQKNLNPIWQKLLKSEFNKDYFKNIENFLEKEYKSWKTIFPPEDLIFNAFNSTSLEDLKVVIIWQDPYHWAGQAHWLCFSVQDWVKIPPSLRNIFLILMEDFYLLKGMRCQGARCRTWEWCIWLKFLFCFLGFGCGWGIKNNINIYLFYGWQLPLWLRL